MKQWTVLLGDYYIGIVKRGEPKETIVSITIRLYHQWFDNLLLDL